ncbi:MAG: hypothetical protein JST91_29695 [Actinobacteria bacterium]|nr:hypothetical protein [Actinomycetota bacterium]
MSITTTGTPVQICTRCAEHGDRKPKPLTKFAKSRNGGHRTICTSCVRKQQARIRAYEQGEVVTFPDLDWTDIRVEGGRHQRQRQHRIAIARDQYDRAKAYFPKAAEDEQGMLIDHVKQLWQFATDEAVGDPWTTDDQLRLLGFTVSHG